MIRTKRQRRADAVMALVNGETAMTCLCGSEQCPAARNAGEASAGGVVIHVLAEASTVQGEGTKPGFLAGYGAVPPATVRDLAKTARLRPVTIPKDIPEPQYRPSTALAEFVRCRDLTCRWMGCDKPAWTADIDHTVPYPLGPTHPSNNDCYCRFHHLMKTFICGPGGWNVTQLPDGTVIFTSPSGRIHMTKPFGALLFPQLAVPTGGLELPNAPPPGENRGISMPKRKRTRAQARAYRIQRERNINAARYAADPPPF